MGFEQLAVLKQQLTKEAKEAKRQAAKPLRLAQPAESKATGRGPKNGAVDPVLRAIGKLQKRFPAAFPKNPAPKVPLKIGILTDLLTHAGELALNEAEIRHAVGTWCRGSRYWACLTDGAARVDLAGASAGLVTARDAAFARNQAKGAYASRRRGRGAPPPDNAPTRQPPSAAGEVA
ncbi:prop effector [Trinickia violacea]|uniref:Prop effector n=1 Tax=Trinickia violacea TaxID=2571746 RepID=A0A4P8IXV5_9BURK|nr:ProQ/FinO family protein [Trinickia violacea]QCP53246.1 prop effector [Trinickia violacea]